MRVCHNNKSLSKDLSDLNYFIDYISSLKEIIPKDDLIVEACKDKSVLDLGCIDHSSKLALDDEENWLHAQIKRVAKEIIGLDILAEDAAELNRHGYHIEVGNVETFDFARRFDVIVAGDLIEHLSNIGLFLDAVSNHMHSESLFIITTPNPFNIEQFAQTIFRNSIEVNLDHTVWLDPRVMHQLISRSRLRIVDFKWIDTRFKIRLKGGRFVHKIVNRISEMVIRHRPICRRDFAVILKKVIT